MHKRTTAYGFIVRVCTLLRQQHVSTNKDNEAWPLSGVVVHHRHNCIIQTHGIGVAGPDTRVLVDPSKDLLMPNQAVFLVCDPIQRLVLKLRLCSPITKYSPMILIGEVEQSAWDATHLQDIE